MSPKSHTNSLLRHHVFWLPGSVLQNSLHDRGPFTCNSLVPPNIVPTIEFSQTLNLHLTPTNRSPFARTCACSPSTESNIRPFTGMKSAECLQPNVILHGQKQTCMVAGMAMQMLHPAHQTECPVTLNIKSRPITFHSHNSVPAPTESFWTLIILG